MTSSALRGGGPAAALILALLFTCFTALAADQPCRLQNVVVERDIAARTARLRGNEFCEYRRYTVGDWDGDGLNDLAVTFNVEGVNGSGNGIAGYLLVYLSSRHEAAPLEAPVGTRGEFLPDALEPGIGRTIVVKTVVWSPRDAMCCPSLHGSRVFKVTPAGLVPERSSRAK
ncbi:MAG TPA: hypothetical protein VF219_23270 [Vicinamibacterales bacterium]